MASLDKVSLNNQIVSMRSDVKIAKRFAINKIVKEVRVLQNKKGPEAQKNKFIRKSKRLIDEVYLIKKLKNDEISKFMLTNKEDPLSIINSLGCDQKVKALAKVCRNKILKVSLLEFKKKYPDWHNEVTLLLPQLGKRVKNKNKLIPKENVFAEKSVDSLSKNKIIAASNENLVNTAGNNRFLVENIKTMQPSKKTIAGSTSYNNLVNTGRDNTFLVENIKRMQPSKECQAKNGKQKLKKKREKLIEENEIFKESSLENEDSKIVLQNIKNKFQEKGEIKKNETKVVDPFFVTNDDTEYFTVATSEKQIEALKNSNEDKIYNTNNKFGGPNNFNIDKRFNGNKRFSNSGTESNYHSRSFEKRNFTENINLKNCNVNRHHKRSQLYEANSKQINEEKLHPSWEAKKKQSSMTQFTGKKIVFNDDD